MKRLIYCCAAVITALSMMRCGNNSLHTPVLAAAATPVPTPIQEPADVFNLDFEYMTIGNEVTITKYIGEDTEVVIPHQIDGCTVVSIGASAFFNCFNITSITIPDSVTGIGGFAFYACWSLTDIIIPDSVNSIGEFAFSFTALTSVTIPGSVTSIGEDTFADCRSLTEIVIPDSVISIGDSTFVYCIRLTSVTIPESVISIGDNAFYRCYSLESVYFEGSPPEVGSGVFDYTAENFTIFYKPGMDDWTTPTWNDYSAKMH